MECYAIRCKLRDPLSNMSGNDISAIGWYRPSSFFTQDGCIVCMYYTFCFMKVPINVHTLSQLETHPMIESLDMCRTSSTKEFISSLMNDPINTNGHDHFHTQVEKYKIQLSQTWTVIKNVQPYDPRIESTLFASEEYRTEWQKMSLLTVFTALSKSLNPHCPHLYLGDVAKVSGIHSNRNTPINVSCWINDELDQPIPYFQMTKEELRAALSLLNNKGHHSHIKALQQYLIHLINAKN